MPLAHLHTATRPHGAHNRAAFPSLTECALCCQIREDWKYVAMVIDRLQLYLFFGITTFGTIAILLDAPHIFQPIDQDLVIKMNRHE